MASELKTAVKMLEERREVDLVVLAHHLAEQGALGFGSSARDVVAALEELKVARYDPETDTVRLIAATPGA